MVFHRGAGGPKAAVAPHPAPAVRPATPKGNGAGKKNSKRAEETSKAELKRSRKS